MSNTIQIKRFNETGETPDDRGTVLAYGELAVNIADNTLWVGNDIGVNQLLSAHTRIGPDEPVMPADKLIGTFWFDTTIPESIKVWNGTDFVTFAGGDLVEPGGQVDSVVAGTNVTVDNTDPANPIVSATGGGGGGAVDSVNDQTGVVSLGIQDMDDFELYGAASSLTFSDKFTGTLSTLENNQWAVLDSGDFWIYLPKNATTQLLVGGTEVTLEMSTGFSLTATVDNNNTAQTNLHALRWDAPYPVGLADLGTAAAGTSLTITSTALAAGYVPLANGDTLQWDESEQAFRPVQLPTGGGGGSSDVEVLGDLADVQVGVGYAGFTEYVNSTALIVEDYQYVVAGDYMSYTNAAAEAAMQRFVPGDQIIFTWGEGGPGKTVTKTIQNGSQFNNATTEYIRWTSSGGWPTDSAILALPLFLTSNPEKFLGAAEGDVLTFDGANWVPEQPTGGGGGSSDVEVLDDLDDVSVVGFSESTRVRSGNLPTAPGEYRCGSNFIQTHISHREQWEKYQVGDELTFVYSTGLVKGPFTVTTVYAIDSGGDPWGLLYASDAPNGDDMNDGALQGMTVFSNPERAVPETGEVLTYDGTNWVPQELEFTDRAVLTDLDDVDLDFSVNAGIDDDVIGSVYTTPGAYRISSGSTVLIYRKEIHDQMSSLQLGDIFYFRWPSVNEVVGPFKITAAPTVNDPNTYYLYWGAVGGGAPDNFTLPAGGPPMYMTFGTPVGHALVFDGINWVAQATVDVLNDLTDVNAGDYAVVMGTDGNPELGPDLWEFGGAGNTLIFHNSISAEMSQFLVDDAIYVTWPSEDLSYGPFIITVAPGLNGANTEYLRVAETIEDIPIPAGNPPMSLKKIGVNAGDVLTYNGQEWTAQPQLPPLPFSLTDMQEALAESTDFESFKKRMACL